MMAPTTDNAGYTGDPGTARASLEALRAEIAKAVVGQDPAVTGLVVALLCRGHVLLEGVPGVAKTLLVRALASALELDTKRVQFTPDLMPSDVTGSLVYDARTAEFSFQPGPVFTNLLLADEINRTPPKTQSSLLEAMEERQVTVDGTPRPLPEPFLVAATQNPVEYEGTYPLPEAQLDRFLLKLTIPLPVPPGRDQRPHPPRGGLQPARPARRRRTPRRGPRRPRSRPRGRRQDRGLPRNHRLRRRHLPRHPRIPVPHPRRLPARRDGAPRHGPRLGLADRPRLRHPRRREGPRPPDPPPPRPAPPGSRDGRRDGRLRHQRDPRPRPRPPLMALTGRAALLAALGTLPVGIWEPSWTGILAVNAPLALACACDFALAAPVRRLGLTRSGDTSVRLGETADVTLTVTNPSGRPLRARIRDAWPPSSWQPGTEVAASRHARHGPRRRTPTRHHPSAPHPPRRPPRRPRHDPLVRPSRPLRPPGQPQGPLDGTRPAPLHQPQAPPLQAGPAARTRRPHQRPDPRRGHRVRQPARVRPRRRHPLDRLARHRPPDHGRRTHLAPRTRPPHPPDPRHRPHFGGPRRRHPPPRRLHGRGPAPGRPGLPRRRPRGPPRLRPPRTRPGPGPRRRRCPSVPGQRHGHASNRNSSKRTPAA